MALADVFDALISKRVYKSAFTVENAIEIIVEGKGKHFDPEIVEAFMCRLEDFRNIAARYRDLEKA
jgi:putative two-component system response regulator